MFKDLLDEIKGFKYQKTVKVLLSKHKENEGIEFAPVYFNINSKYMLDKSLQDFLYKIYNWINEGSGRVIESIEAEYVNISVYSKFSWTTYIELHNKLRNPMKGLINMKNNFLGVTLDT